MLARCASLSLSAAPAAASPMLCAVACRLAPSVGVGAVHTPLRGMEGVGEEDVVCEGSGWLRDGTITWVWAWEERFRHEDHAMRNEDGVKVKGAQGEGRGVWVWKSGMRDAGCSGCGTRMWGVEVQARLAIARAR